MTNGLEPIPVAAVMAVLDMQRRGDIGGVIYEMMDWGTPNCWKRWQAVIASEQRKHDGRRRA